MAAFLETGLNILGGLLVLAVIALLLVVAVLYVIDRVQTADAVRRNFPVIGRFRYLFQHLGEFFRQYFFALDREELPFNRAERAWVHRAATGADMTVAFGSTRDLRPVGTVIFANTPFAMLEADAAEPAPVVIGPGARQPYEAASFFNISGMSFGAISRPAVLALSRGAASAGCWMNTGEGGLSPYHIDGGADIVYQIGTAKYGVRDERGGLSDERLAEIAGHARVRMFEIKLAQGAKPGKGGILPAIKVTEEIARIRLIAPGEDSISPNRHEEVDSVEDLLDMVAHVRDVTGKPVGFKTVIGDAGFIDALCRVILERGTDSAPDFIAVDSGDGGSGAAPQSLIDNMGLTIREALPMVVDTLTLHGLRERIRVVASGKLINPSEVAWALCMGADFITSARGFMFAIGCIQSLQCNRNTCPTGVATHDPRLQRGLDPTDKAERVARYVEAMHREVGIIAHSCGVTDPRHLQRRHCRMIAADGRSVAMDQRHPEQERMQS